MDNTPTITGTRSPVGTLTGKLAYSVAIPVPDYDGAYRVTPSGEEQILPTQGHTLADNIVIEAIPQNYGLITWDGSTLTVS